MKIDPSLARGAGLPQQRAKQASRIRDRGISIVVGGLVWLMIIYMTVPDHLFDPVTEQQATAEMSQPNPGARLLKLGLLFSGLIIMLGRSAKTRALLKSTNRYFLAFLALVPLSYLWSISPGDTLARYISILSFVAPCMAFAVVAWHPRRYQNVVRPVITLLLVASILLYYYNPNLAIEHGVGTLHDAWHGVASQKNHFGMISSFGVIFWLHGLLSGEVGLVSGLAGLALGGSCVVLSRSSTSMLATILSCFFLVLLLRSPPSLRRYMPYIVGTFVVMVLVYALTILHLVPELDILLTPITHLTGKDMTFSNRTVIWQIIKEHIQLSPWIGTGYGAYWIGPVPRSPSYTFLAQMYFYPTESHNGYLEITNDLGFLGLAILFGYLVQFVRSSLDVMRVDRIQGALYLAMFFQQAIMNLSESTWLAINSTSIFPIMTVTTMALARSLLEQRTAARAAAAQRAHQAARPYNAAPGLAKQQAWGSPRPR